MRIISGNFKGKKIIQPKDLNTRPLKDLTKESIFNFIAHSKKIRLIYTSPSPRDGLLSRMPSSA